MDFKSNLVSNYLKLKNVILSVSKLFKRNLNLNDIHYIKSQLNLFCLKHFLNFKFHLVDFYDEEIWVTKVENLLFLSQNNQLRNEIVPFLYDLFSFFFDTTFVYTNESVTYKIKFVYAMLTLNDTKIDGSLGHQSFSTENYFNILQFKRPKLRMKILSKGYEMHFNFRAFGLRQELLYSGQFLFLNNNLLWLDDQMMKRFINRRGSFQFYKVLSSLGFKILNNFFNYILKTGNNYSIYTFVQGITTPRDLKIISEILQKNIVINRLEVSQSVFFGTFSKTL